MDHLIIDGFGLAFRSHFAFLNLQTSKGISSGCVYGFLVGARTIKNRFPQNHVTIAWDSHATRRKELFPEYKATRPKFALTEQILDLKEIFKHLNVSQAECAGEEGDDVIATLVKQYQEEDNLITIYSADKDMLQLVKDGKVVAIRPKSGARPERVFDEEEVKKEYGVGPEDLVSYFCFRGDTVDNIPGVKMLRSACIVDLIKKYKEPKEIYKNLQAEKLTHFQRESLEFFEPQAYLNMRLVKLIDDLEFNVEMGSPDPEQVAKGIEKYEINSIKPETYVKVFVDVSGFNYRRSPTVKSFSLFD
jgi:DNA polymerase-1